MQRMSEHGSDEAHIQDYLIGTVERSTVLPYLQQLIIIILILIAPFAHCAHYE